MEVASNGVGVANVYQEAVLLVVDLEWDASGTGGNDGLALVESLGDLDFEAFARGELADDLCGRNEGVEHLVGGTKMHDDDVVGVLSVFVLLQEGHDLVGDDGGIRVIDGAVAADEELRDFGEGELSVHELAGFAVGIDKVRDTLGRVEAGDLANVVAGWVLQLGPGIC